MNNNRDQKNNHQLELIKWSSIITLIFIIIIGNYYYQFINLFIRIILIIFSSIMIYKIFSITQKGIYVLDLINESKIELKKIIWPNYKETLYTTLIVSIVTTIMSLILWILDRFLFYLVSLITNIRW
ncbi:Protein translocase subunit SecE [Buchnera aphidicola (Eriosoma grossulariae)]|uniref:preprotein translocase subunit SecE n=1 Tax=Buchnera aphidicola TaxID=9 RepID=UPI003463E9F3